MYDWFFNRASGQQVLEGSAHYQTSLLTLFTQFVLKEREIGIGNIPILQFPSYFLHLHSPDDFTRCFPVWKFITSAKVIKNAGLARVV